VIDPPDFGVPVDAEDDELDEPPDAPAAEDDDFDDEPHALTNAAIENRQAATAASLRKRMASLILGSPPRAANSPALPSAEKGVHRGQRGADVNTIVNDLVVPFGRNTQVEWRPCTDRQLRRFP
jgi:hypothetical protein